MTFGERLETFKGVGPGFDHLRIGLSITILAWHSFGFNYGQDWVDTVPGYVLAPLAMLLPMFFGLSGFLIMGSAVRTNDVRLFITFRFLRIFPALFVEILMSAIVLGAVVTTLPLKEYYLHPKFFEYFGSLIGSIKYWLPGVFESNPITVVNGALWTVGPEILCYCFVAALMVLGAFTMKKPMVGALIAYVGICIVTDRWDDDWNVVHLPTKALILSFISGNVIYLYRYKIPHSLGLFVAAALISILSIVVAQRSHALRPIIYVPALLIPYCSTFIGLSALRLMPFFHRGDYSYGIYIYASPIQQTIIHYFPELRAWWFNLAVALPVTVVLAVLSWHLVEEPFLRLRKRLSQQTLNPRPASSGMSLRRLPMLILIVMYGLFVMNAARVFPLKAIYNSVMGRPAETEKIPIQQL